ncbi:MAG: MFS transporter [Acidobacteriaceae bacterium]|nr:MFS transporter [Acidobacteriaceae bacterium]MBV9502677.1 MFS transporter [Acidobacteriaceae bacterium]
MPDDKVRSLRALDALNFCNAGIQTGLGPFIAIFYTAVRHWHPGQVGVLIACQSVAGIVLQTWIGSVIDESHHKRLWTAVAGTIVALGAIGIVTLPSYGLQVAIQLIIGIAVTVFPATTSAFALGMVAKDQLSGRIARNESFTHGGNVVFAVTAGAVGTLLALQGIFYAAALFAAGMAPSVLFIRAEHVDYEAARGADKDDAKQGEQKKRTGWKELLTDRRIVTFTAAVVLFYFANSATLPLVSEILTRGEHGRRSAWEVAAAVVAAEAVMVGIAAITGKLADKWGRKPLFLIGFGVLAVRNALTVISHNEYYLISLQSLDGVAMGLYGVLLTLITADLAKGTGRFNRLQGAVQSAMGLGGLLSNSLFGWIAKALSFDASFWGLSAVAILGGLLYQFRMPETRDSKSPSEAEQPEQSSAAV